MMNSYQELKVWQMAMNVATEIYDWTKVFPKHEMYGLSSQLQRSAVSVPANIAEGHGRSTTRDYLRHLSIARGSLAELETEILLAKQIGYGDMEKAAQLLEGVAEVSRMLRGLQKALQEKRRQQERPVH